MTHHLHAFIELAAAYRSWAYGFVFLLALSESVPVVGAIVPGSTIIIALSALVPTGALDLWPILAAAVAGAVVGDGVGYWLGRRYHRDIVRLWPLSRSPALITRSERFFRDHGGKSVFLARFTPAVRAFVPLVAGILGMRAGRFYAVNVASALVWAPSHILSGVGLGDAIAMGGGMPRLIAWLPVALGAGLALWALHRAWRRSAAAGMGLWRRPDFQLSVVLAAVVVVTGLLMVRAPHRGALGNAPPSIDLPDDGDAPDTQVD